MKSSVKKRSVYVGERMTSVSLEDEFWSALKEIADAENLTTVYDLVTRIDVSRREHEWMNLSSALRVFVIKHYMSKYRQTLTVVGVAVA